MKFGSAEPSRHPAGANAKTKRTSADSATHYMHYPIPAGRAGKRLPQTVQLGTCHSQVHTTLAHRPSRFPLPTPIVWKARAKRYFRLLRAARPEVTTCIHKRPEDVNRTRTRRCPATRRRTAHAFPGRAGRGYQERHVRRHLRPVAPRSPRRPRRRTLSLSCHAPTPNSGNG